MQMYLYISNDKTYIHKKRHISIKLKPIKGINNHINQKTTKYSFKRNYIKIKEKESVKRRK